MHINYDDILYDKPNNKDLQNKMEEVQRKTCLVIFGTIQGASRKTLWWISVVCTNY